MASRKKIDWDAIEKDYRAGVMTVRAISKKHGTVTDMGIAKHAERHGWAREVNVQVVKRVERVKQTKVTTPAEAPEFKGARKRPIVDAEASEFISPAASQSGQKSAYQTPAFAQSLALPLDHPSRATDAVLSHLALAARIKAIAVKRLELLEKYYNGTADDRAEVAVILFPTRGDSLQSAEKAAAYMAESAAKIERVSLNVGVRHSDGPDNPPGEQAAIAGPETMAQRIAEYQRKLRDVTIIPPQPASDRPAAAGGEAEVPPGSASIHKFPTSF